MLHFFNPHTGMNFIARFVVAVHILLHIDMQTILGSRVAYLDVWLRYIGMLFCLCFQ